MVIINSSVRFLRAHLEYFKTPPNVPGLFVSGEWISDWCKTFHTVADVSRPKLRELKASALAVITPGIGGAIRSAHRRGLGGSEWLRMRRLVWTEQKGQCAACGTLGRPDQQELDHIHPVHLGGGDERSNLQMLCKRCHASKTAQEQGARTGKVLDDQNRPR